MRYRIFVDALPDRNLTNEGEVGYGEDEDCDHPPTTLAELQKELSNWYWWSNLDHLSRKIVLTRLEAGEAVTLSGLWFKDNGVNPERVPITIRPEEVPDPDVAKLFKPEKPFLWRGIAVGSFIGAGFNLFVWALRSFWS